MAVTATHRIEANLSGSTVKDQFFDEELTDFDAVTPAWDGEVDEVADFDATVDIDGDMTDAPGMGHDGGNALEFEFDNDTVACGVINADAVDQTSGVISFWFNRNDLALEDGKNIHLVRVLDGGANTSYQIRLLNTGGVYSITLNTRLDDGTIPTNVTFSPLDTNWHKITVMFSRSSGAGNNDGFSYLYVDDVYIGGEEGIDNDTKDWDVVRVGVGSTSSTTFGGSFYMDTIKIDPVGAPMLDTLAAQNGTYGLSIPVMDATVRHCSFTDPTAETAIIAECNLDPNTITMGAAESFTFISGDAADFTVNLKYSGGYKINAVAALDAGTDATSDYDITDAPHKIRVVWVASSIAAADDGYLKLYIDDVLQETLSGLDNDTLDIGSVYFGAYTGLDAGTYGIFYLDDCWWGPWVDLTSDVIGDITGYWGMMDNDPTTFIADTGPMEITMNNVSGVYTPGLTTSLAGWDKGTPIRLLFQYDSVPYIRSYGTIDDIDPEVKGYPEPEGDKVRVTVTDWMNYAATHPLISPAIVSNKRADELMTTVVADMTIAPLATDYETGANTFETGFDTLEIKTKAYSEMSKIGTSEIAPIYLLKDPVFGETLVCESFYTRNGLRTPGFIMDNNMLHIDIDYGKNVINRFEGTAHPRVIEAGISVLFTLSSPILIPSLATIENLRGNYTDPDGGNPTVGANMINPVITTDYLMNTKKDGTGANISASLTVTASYGAAGVVYKLVNANGYPGWVIKLQARGYMVFSYNQLQKIHEDTDSQDEFGILSKTLDQKYQKEIYWGSLFGDAIVNLERYPRNKVNKVTFIANRSDDLMTAWLTGDVGMVCSIIEDKTETEIYAYIQGIEFTISTGGVVKFSWIVKVFLSLAMGLSLISCEFDNGLPDAINYGYLPQVSGDSVTTRSVSLWMNADTISYDMLMGESIDYAQFFFYVADAGPGPFVAIRNSRYVTTSGNWTTPVNSISTGSWINIIYTLDIRDIAADPKIYVGGVSQVITEASTPVGAALTLEKADLMFGNLFLAGGYVPNRFPFDGEIKDIRIYNVILTQAEATSLAGGGDVTRGMVFHSPCVKTSDLSDFEDKALTASDRMIDNMYGIVGKTSGTVTTRLIP